MKHLRHSANVSVTASRIARFFRFAGFFFLVFCAVLACTVALHRTQQSVLAQSVDLRAIAARYPKYTRQQQMAVLQARQDMLHPQWKNMSMGQAMSQLLKILGKTFAHAAASSSTPPLAPFAGNLTFITAPGTDDLLIQRQSDCSLTLKTGAVAYSFGQGGGVTVDGTTTHYDATLHTEAGLSTKAGVFPNGCSDPKLGISTRIGMYLGQTSQGQTLSVATGYYPPTGNNTLYYEVANTTTNTGNAFQVDSSDPNVVGVTAGDLNGDGLSDIVTIDQGTSVAGVNVRLAKLNGTIAAGVTYTLPGKTAEAATMDDVNGDGKADVVAASIDASGQEYVSVLTGNGDGTLNAAVSVKVPTPTYPTSLGSSGTSSPPVIGSTSPIPIVNLVTANLTGTGHRDIVTSNGVVLLNNGTGTLTLSPSSGFTARDATSRFGPNLAAGDVNNDGKQDIVLDDGQQISIFLSNGDGTFAIGATYASDGEVGYLTVTDLDGDGNADIYEGMANAGSFGGDQFNQGQSYAIMGNGDGTFRGALSLPFGYSGSNVVDLNNDGKPDLVGVIATPLDVVTFNSYLNNGTGGFTASSSLSVSPAMIGGVPCYFGGVDSFAFGDVNGDGISDLVYLPEGCGTSFFVATGKGDGSFNAPALVALPAGFDSITSIQMGDFNHDGKIDVAFAFSSGMETATITSGFAVQLGNGDGTFKAPVLTQTSSAPSIQSSAPEPFIEAIGDVNGDGFPDIFTAQAMPPVCSGAGCGPITGYLFQLYIGKGDGTFQSPYAMPANPGATGGIIDPFSQVLLADMNGDGHLDVVALNPLSAGGLGIYLGKGDGTFATPSNVNYAGAGLAVADFNGDGKLDVAIAGYNSGILFGNGDGTVQSSTDSSSGEIYPSQQIVFQDLFNPGVAADFNGDGKPDFFFGNTLLLSQTAPATAPTLTASTTTLTAAPTSATLGQAVVLTATVGASTGTGTPTGTVTFYDGTTSLGTGNLTSGVATLSTSTLTVASHSITAAYSGDTSYSTSTSAAVIVSVSAAVVTPLSTTTALTASSMNAVAGTSLIFTATVTPASSTVAPTGTITFFDGTTSIGTGTLASSVATLTTATLAAGSHSITASYGGDAGNAASTSSAVAVTITATVSADFSIGLSALSGSVVPGKSITSTISITPTGGFNQQVSLACSGAPKHTTCTIAPSSVTPTGTAAATATLTVQTDVNTTALENALHSGGGDPSGYRAVVAFAGMAAFFVCTFGRKRLRGWSYRHLLIFSALLAVTTLIACGGSSHATPPGASTLTVTATAGATTHTATFALTVQ